MKNIFSTFLKPFRAGSSNSLHTAFNAQSATDFNKNREKSKHHTVCFAPSVNMLFATDGTVKACCHNSENSLGRYPEKSIREIWNSEEAKHFRKKMNEYQFLSGCSGCARDYRARAFNEMPAKHFDMLPLHPDYPSMMEFLWSNTCNLECVMCSGELSSSIRKNRDHLPPIKTPYDDEFINQLQEFVPHLVETRFSGAGEAFSIPMNFDFWETLIQNNPECKIVVQTNGTVLNTRVKDFLQRGNFHIGVSLDSLDKETFESIRINASFEKVMENIQYFSDYSKQHNRTFTISTCVMRQNWKELPAFIKFCNNLNANATFHKVWSPLPYALYNLPPVELAVIYNKLSQADLPDSSALELKNKKHYEYFVAVIKEWMNDAKNHKVDKNEYQHLGTDELQARIKLNVAEYINQQLMLEPDKVSLIALCENKIDGVAELWCDEDSRRKMLLHLCAVPVNEMLPSLKINSVEKLFEMSALSLRN